LLSLVFNVQVSTELIVKLRWSESLRCWRSSKSKASLANLTKRYHNPLDTARASDLVCGRILHKVDAEASHPTKYCFVAGGENLLPCVRCCSGIWTHPGLPNMWRA
jgi:hypothetical protein